MGGQACILYGAAEFSRDIDFAVAVSAGMLARASPGGSARTSRGSGSARLRARIASWRQETEISGSR